MKIAFISLGCDKNRVNTEQMMALCQAAGHEVTGEPDGADVAVVNTCGFIDSAKEEAIATILEVAPLKETGRLKKLLVAGCLSQRYQDEVLTELPEVDGILGTGSYTDIVSAAEAAMAGETPKLFGDIDRTVEDGARLVSTPSYTAFLKIAEGCNNRCAFCVIPSLRGRYRSRPMESLLAEAGQLAGAGVKELILVAQDITRYGTDLYGRHALPELLRELCRLDFHWIRLHYFYPDEVTDELIEVVASERKIVKYLDIPLQHCNDGILKAMNRRGTKAQIEALLGKLRARIPGLVIRTSIICGLPGEGEAEFEELCGFLRENALERAGVFAFSPEEGSPAADMPDQVPEDVKRRRVELLTDLQMRIVDDYCANMVGKVIEVLCEGYDDETELYYGRSAADSPDIDGLVHFEGEEGGVRPGGFYRVKVTNFYDGELVGVRYDDDEEEAQ